MIEERSANILTIRDCEALVNPVNCRGVMGRGLARQFARQFPQMLPEYRRICSQRLLRPGAPYLHRVNEQPPRYVVSFPTKDDWRNDSRLEWISAGMVAMMNLLREHEITSVAIPQLGAGLGGLYWHDVRPVIVQEALRHPDINTVIVTPPTQRATMEQDP